MIGGAKRAQSRQGVRTRAERQQATGGLRCRRAEGGGELGHGVRGVEKWEGKGVKKKAGTANDSGLERKGGGSPK